MKTNKMTRSQKCAADVAASLRARSQLILVRTSEEARVESHLFEAAIAAKYVPHTWDVAQGVCDMGGKPEQIGDPDPMVMINAIRERSQRKTETPVRDVWIMRDLPVWLAGPPGAPVVRNLRNFARSFIPPITAQAVIIISPSSELPAELASQTTIIEWPLPDREELAAMLDALIEQYNLKDMLKNGKRDAAIDAAVGLSDDQAQACFNKSLVQSKTVDPVMVAQEKKRVIASERVLEWYDPLPDGLNAVGGLENLKSWFLSRTSAYTPEARAYGLPLPKGMFLIGISGCGKTLTCKAISTVLQCPLIRVDLGALKGKFLGQSEGNLRKVYDIVKAIGRCVVWFDEVEKSLAGATQGAADGGVSADQLGSILTWMQERQGEAFVVMTANDVTGLPPEFLRKGRFDEIWWVDLPTQTERVAVLNAALRANNRSTVKIDVAKVAGKPTEGFTGSEIAAIVPDAMFAAFADGAREITTDDLVDAASTVVPLSKTAGDKINKMREWAKGKARPATKPDTETAVDRPRVRQLDIVN